jgi:threonine dehydratase
MSIRISRGVTRTLDPPEHEVRLQVLNGCGVDGLAASVADAWADYTDADLHVVVVDTDNFDLHNVAESFIISRQENRTAARLLADRVGLNPDQVVYKSLENNYRDVTATLVLGADWPDIEATQQKKE